MPSKTTFDKMTSIMTEVDKSGVGLHASDYAVLEAMEIFQECGIEDDFCLQDISYDSIIFGSVHRLRWSHRGWTAIDMPECFAELYPLYAYVTQNR